MSGKPSRSASHRTGAPNALENAALIKFRSFLVPARISLPVHLVHVQPIVDDEHFEPVQTPVEECQPEHGIARLCLKFNSSLSRDRIIGHRAHILPSA